MKLWLAVFILVTAAASVYGQREPDTLTRVDQLIAAKEYDAAMQLVSEYIQDNPSRFSAGQQRIRRIVRIRQQFNDLAEQLLNTVEKNPENNAQMIRLIDRMLALENPSNPLVSSFLDRVWRLADFNINRNRLEAVFKTAERQLNHNDFAAALATYAAGLDIYQEAFFSSGFGREAETLVSRNFQSINQNIELVNALLRPFAAAAMIAEFDRTHSNDLAELQRLYGLLLPRMRELVTVQENFSRTWSSFNTLATRLQTDEEFSSGRSFLVFASRLISGHPGSRDGMMGVVERLWHQSLDPLETAFTNITSRLYEAGYIALEAESFAQATTHFEAASRVVAAAQDFLRTSHAFAAIGSERTLSLDGFPAYIKFRSMTVSISFLQRTVTTLQRGAAITGEDVDTFRLWQTGELSLANALSHNQRLRNQLQSLVTDLRSFEAGVLAEYPSVPSEGIAYLTRTHSLIARFADRFQARLLAVITAHYAISNENLNRQITAREVELLQGERLVSGIAEENENPENFAALNVSPGIDLLNRIAGLLQADITAAATLMGNYANEGNNTLSAPEMAALHHTAQTLHEQLLALQSRVHQALALGRGKVNRAAALHSEGDRLFNAAQAALNRSDFDTARNNLTRAAEQYDASLALLESNPLRQFRDTNVLRLGEEIVRLENEAAVRDVRALLTTVQANFLAGAMEQAEETLVRAQNRWRIINTAEHAEIEHWLLLVRNALARNFGRHIPLTAPLYAEMSQLLSGASRNVNEGVRLINAGRRNEGIVLFNDALDKIRGVRLVFPMNHEARLLQMQIEQHTDPAAFNRDFRERLNAAVQQVKNRNAEAYADLLSYAAINPNFPGMRAIITQAEIDMGFRPPPPNPADLAQSAELTRAAQANINNGSQVLLMVAEVQLTDAIKLDANNIQAQTLMDRLRILLRGSGSIVLPSNVQVQYNNALQEFLQGNILTAHAIVEQLLQTPANRNSTQIMDLRRRIDLRL